MDAHKVVLHVHNGLLSEFQQTLILLLPFRKSNRGLICISCSTNTKCQFSLSVSYKSNLYNICVSSAPAK